MNKLWLVVLITLCISTLSFAEEYYADITINVENDGTTILSGTTNHPILTPQTTQDFTSKNGSIWTLTLNPKGDFSEYIYTIKLPTGAEIIDINLPQHYRVSLEGEKLVVVGTGENLPLFIDIEYKINQTILEKNYLPYLIGAGLAIILAILYFFILKKKPTKALNEEQKVFYNKDALSERQLQIVQYLEKNNGKAIQSELQKETKLPKASLSRNIAGLERKGIISKERKGMSMLIFFNKEKPLEEQKIKK